MGLSYTEDEKNQFPDVSIKEFQTYVKKHCGTSWWQHILQVKKIGAYPTNIGISQYYLKVIGTRKSDGEKVEKLFFIDQLMGC